MMKALFKGCKQNQIIYKKQTVDPAASSSDTFIVLAVTD